MEEQFRRAIKNIACHGDTDIFPFPPENALFFDQPAKIVSLLEDLHREFDGIVESDPPFFENQLSPLGYSGLRWGTQIDPLWNAYFLALVLSISDRIEAARLPANARRVFSYRIVPDKENENLFAAGGWQQFHERSLQLAQDAGAKVVVICDISNFYYHIRHHRLENALNRLPGAGNTPARIMKLLARFSKSYSHGIPVGGPASRILSELLLDQVDQLLEMQGITFCRYADDYHIFADSEDQGFDGLLFLTQKLLDNEGLSLQRSKTRIVSHKEFIRTSPILQAHQEEAGGVRTFLGLSLRFDPYSPTAVQDYQVLKSEVEKYDIVGLLRKEVSKSRVDVSLTRQIIKSLRFIDPAYRNVAVLTLLDNLEVLYPLFPSVTLVLKDLWKELSEEVKESLCRRLRDLFRDGSRLVKTDVNKCYALRVLACERAAENMALMANVFRGSSSNMLRRDIIILMCNLQNHAWISDLKNQFSHFSPPLRRAFILASYVLGDEGKHWRQHNKKGFKPLEVVVRDWWADGVGGGQGTHRVIPL